MEKHVSLKKLFLFLCAGFITNTQASSQGFKSNEMRNTKAIFEEYYRTEKQIELKKLELRSKLQSLKEAEKTLSVDTVPAYLQKKEAIINLVVALNNLESRSLSMYRTLRFNSAPLFSNNEMSHEYLCILRDLKNSPPRKLQSHL